jgi:hypothetical protein
VRVIDGTEVGVLDYLCYPPEDRYSRKPIACRWELTEVLFVKEVDNDRIQE